MIHALIAGALALSAASAAAQGEGEAPRWATEVTRELMSPFCPGVTIAECPSDQAKSLSAWIVEQAREGRSRDDVLAQLYDRYGDQVRATPRAEGFGVTAYVIPALAFVAGGVGLALFLRRATRAAPPPVPSAPLDPAQERRLDEALSR